MHHVATSPEPEKVVEVVEGNLLWKMGKVFKPKNEHRAQFFIIWHFCMLHHVPQIKYPAGL